jgi:cellobiose phosphorylase
MKFGYFDDDNREYVITDPKTPTRWINYIGTLKFGGFVDQTGGALICRGDPALNRITKYIPQLPGSTFNGEGLYLRVKQSDGYLIYSPFFTPTLRQLDSFEAHVGLGYTTFISELEGLRCEVAVFIPSGAEIELRDIRLTNIGSTALEVDVIPVVAYTHPDALKQFTNADWIPQTMVSRAIEEDGGFVILKQYPFMLRDSRHNFFTSNQPASSFETDRAVFLGKNGYGSFKRPGGLLNPELANTQANRGDNIAALLHPLGELMPGESRRLITQLGQTDTIDELPELVKKYRDPIQVDRAFEELKQFWVEYLSAMQVSTPNADMNHMLNIHNPRQCLITKNWSRYLSLYQLGLGDRGIGFRDSSQDVLGVMSFIPEEAVGLVRNLLSVQKRDGSAMHQYNPLTMVGNTGEADRESARFYSDDHLWVILSVSTYLKETGKMEFLEEEIPFYEKDDRGKPLESGTVLEHLSRGIEFTRKTVGGHELPLLGFADWNDTVNLQPGAESVFSACLYGLALKELIVLTEFLGEDPLAQQWRDYYEEMKEKVNQEAWDGAWYRRYFDADGSSIGSAENTHGKIFANAQSWSILAGYADRDRGRQALDSVNEFLDTDYGIKLSTPGYDGFDPKYGGVSTYPPGAKENGGIFLHANPWAIIAETILGDGDQAFTYYNKINPVTKNEMMEIYESEPYVYPQNILGDEHPQFGLARNSWLTGTASWMYVAATQHILGIRPEYDGLRIRPCIPSEWPGFSARRSLRNAAYEIEVKRDPSISANEIKLVVDGNEHESELVPYFSDGKSHSILVYIHERSH